MELISDIWQYWMNDYEEILTYTYEHIIISFIAILLGILLTLPLGIILSKLKSKWIIDTAFGITNVFQTVPTIALFAIMIPIAGIGQFPAIIALFLYSLLPLLRNTFAGILSVDRTVVESARGMGLSMMQILFKIELPLALPYVVSSIRITAIYIISWTTLAAIIGAGGLGDLILAGIGLNNQVLILSGTLVAILLAFLLDIIIGFIEKKWVRKFS